MNRNPALLDHLRHTKARACELRILFILALWSRNTQFPTRLLLQPLRNSLCASTSTSVLTSSSRTFALILPLPLIPLLAILPRLLLVLLSPFPLLLSPLPVVLFFLRLLIH